MTFTPEHHLTQMVRTTKTMHARIETPSGFVSLSASDEFIFNAIKICQIPF